MLRTLVSSARRIAVTAAVALTAGMACVVGGGSAAADTTPLAVVDKDITYSCTLPLIGTRDLVTRIHVVLPDTGSVGVPIQPTDFGARVSVPEDIVDFYRAFGGERVSGSASAAAHVTKNGAAYQSHDVPLVVPATDVPPTGGMTIPASGPVAGTTPNGAGTYALHAGNYSATLNITDADGNDIIISPMTVPCTAPAQGSATLLGNVAVS